MKRRSWFALILLGGAAVSLIAARSALALPVGNPSVPQPSKPVDLQRYLGLWYEIARYDNGFERGCDGVTAEYRARPDGGIDVINRCRKGGLSGPERSARGRASVVTGSDGAKLKVSFFWPFFGDYWVLDRDQDYAWAIVGEPSGRYLWLLSRDAHPSAQTRALIEDRARAMGYDLSLLRPTIQ